MKPTGDKWDAARKNCLSYKKDQFLERNINKRSFVRMTPELVFKLVDSSAKSAKKNALELKQKLLLRHWRIAATLHRGGRGGKGNPVDDELHFNILFPGGNGLQKEHYHVRCKERADETVYIFDVKSDRRA